KAKNLAPLTHILAMEYCARDLEVHLSQKLTKRRTPMKYYAVSARGKDVSEAIEKLAGLVAAYISLDWVPLGGVSVAVWQYDPQWMLIQAMTNSNSNAEVPQAVESE